MSDKKQAKVWVDKAQQALDQARMFLSDAEEAKLVGNLKALTESVSKILERYAGEKEEKKEQGGG